jgi:hypothetical protein
LSGSEGLEIIDIRNPETPILVGRYRLPSWSSRFGEGGRGIQIANQHAFIVNLSSTGLRVVSLADPLRPEQVANFQERAFRADDVMLGNGLAVLSSENALQIIDVSQPNQPKWRSELKGRATGWAGDLLMVRTREFPARLEFYSLADPAQPKRLARIEADAPVQPASPFPVPAYVAWAGRVQVFDVADPMAPRKAFDVESFDGPGFGAADGNLLSRRSGRAVEFWDLATPLQPARLGSSSSSRFFGTPSPPPFVSVIVRQGLLFGTAAAGDRSRLMIWRTRIGLDPKFTFPNYSVAYTNAPIRLWASSSSGRPVTYRVVSGPGQLTGDRLRLTGTGDVLVVAEQLGDDQWFTVAVTHKIKVKPNTSLDWLTPAVPVVALNSPQLERAQSTEGVAATLRVGFGPARIEEGRLVVTNVGAVQLIA